MGRREAYKYIRLENPWGVGGGRLWGRIGAAGLQPRLAKGLDVQRCSRYPAQSGNSLSRKGKSEMPKMIYCPIHPALYMRVPEHLASMCMYAYVSEFQRKRKTFLQRRKIIRKCLTSYCYIYFCVRLHLFFWTTSNQKRKMFLSNVKVKPYVHPISRDFKRELSLMESCDVQ